MMSKTIRNNAKPSSNTEALTVLFEDDRVVAVMKPAGLATIPGRGEIDSVIEQLSRQTDIPCRGTTDPRLRIVHRLDKETSGVLLLAKDIAAQRDISTQFQNNLVKKEYLAIVAGRPPGQIGTIDGPLAPHPTRRDRMAITKHGRPAITKWQVEWASRGFALIRCFPQTGKTHQIRVHLQSIGLPLAIDPLYNPAYRPDSPGIMLSLLKRDYRPSAYREERPLINRLTLHAERLSFTHPNGSSMDLICPPPKDFRAAMSQLRKL